jgi:hypothetical protein
VSFSTPSKTAINVDVLILFEGIENIGPGESEYISSYSVSSTTVEYV